MTTIQITSVTKDSPGAGQVTIVGTYSDETLTHPMQQVTVADYPAANTAWSRNVRLTDVALMILRNGANGVALLIADSLSKLAVAMEPTLSWAPKLGTQPDDGAAVASSTSVDFSVVAASETTLSYQWQYNKKAVGTLTSDNVNVSDGDQVVVGGVTYTFKAALTPTAGQVLIGADADASLLNLIRAINHTGTAGTDYANLGTTAVANPQVSAAASVTAHAFAVTALTAGSDGNAIATTETSAHLSWGAATLASGGWTNCTGTVNGCAYTNGTTATLTCTPTTTGQNGLSHRCAITNASGTTYSDEVVLTIT